MKIPPRLSRLAVASVALALSGCVSAKYKSAAKDTPPAIVLNLTAAQPPVEATVNTVIIFHGPGSWKRDAFWDEYVVTLHNQGEQPLTIASVTLADPIGGIYPPGTEPWALEKQSKTLEQKYRDAGIAFVRTAGPGVLIVGTGIAGVYTAGIFSGAAGVFAVGTVIVLPAYYIATWVINSDNKATVVAEFKRRRLALPLTLAPGETRTGSLFFPMVPNPRALDLRWSSDASGGEFTLSLEALHGLHLQAPVPATGGSLCSLEAIDGNSFALSATRQPFPSP